MLEFGMLINQVGNLWLKSKYNPYQTLEHLGSEKNIGKSRNVKLEDAVELIL